MRERLFFEVTEDEKKIILEALKNEQKYTKQIPLYDSNDEEICKITKWDVYSNYIDFTLNNVISDSITKKPGAISSIELIDFENKKNIKQKRIKKIYA